MDMAINPATVLSSTLEQFYEKAARVAPETLFKTVLSAHAWYVGPEDYRAEGVDVYLDWTSMDQVARDAWYAMLSKNIERVLARRLQRAAEHGFCAIVVDEPSWDTGSVVMCTLRDRFAALGFNVTLMSVTRHRYCPHNNGTGNSCDYDHDSDGGAGEMTATQLRISFGMPFA